ncbi:MAG: hypothetical protein WCJ52_03895 [Phenylobacterium sp.]|uniref:hypothetical protein n=1 Tax=Phenylobacterium sp. TaxID=1871053 RepID=UPI0030192E72
MRPGALRRLTDGEMALAAAVFGSALALERVRIFALPVWRRPFAAGPALVFWPASVALQDFSQARLSLQGVLIHELTHVWQAQTGVNLALAKLRAGDGPEAYHYAPGFGLGFSDLNIEQQAMAVQHAFLAARGGPTPFAPEVHAALLAGTPLAAAPKPSTV